MRPRLAPIAAVILAGAVLTGCGSDSPAESSESSESPSTSPSAAPATPTVTVTETETATPTEPAASAKTGPQDCAPQGDLRIRILMGRIDCGSAYRVAAQVDRSGEKRQDVAGYVCEFGTAMTRPTIFTCTNLDSGAEFAADER